MFKFVVNVIQDFMIFAKNNGMFTNRFSASVSNFEFESINIKNT